MERHHDRDHGGVGHRRAGCDVQSRIIIVEKRHYVVVQVPVLVQVMWAPSSSGCQTFEAELEERGSTSEAAKSEEEGEAAASPPSKAIFDHGEDCNLYAEEKVGSNDQNSPSPGKETGDAPRPGEPTPPPSLAASCYKARRSAGPELERRGGTQKEQEQKRKAAKQRRASAPKREGSSGSGQQGRGREEGRQLSQRASHQGAQDRCSQVVQGRESCR